MSLAKAQKLVADNAVMVFSKTTCPYCSKVKQLFRSLGTSPKFYELDEEADGGDVQGALAQWTGQRSVPNVFIAGKHIGGCDNTVALHSQGKLVPLLKEAAAV